VNSDAPPRSVLRWSKRAEADLEAIGDYIAADDPRAAERWVGKLLARTLAASGAPFAGRVVPEVRMETVREVFVRTYRIVYRIRESEVQVLTIFEGHRRFPSDLDDDEMDAPEDT
jgi:toxin ParE1/3/4